MLKKHNELNSLYSRGYIEEQPRSLEASISLKSDEWDDVSVDMKKIISFDSDKIYDLIKNEFDYETVSKQIKNAELMTNNVLEKIPTTYINGHAVRIMKLGDFFDKSVTENFDKKYSLFDKTLEQLESCVAVNTAKDLRKKTNEIHSDLESLLDIAKERNIVVSNKKEVKLYSKKLVKINELERKYDEIVSDYQAIDSADGAKKIKKIKKNVSKNVFGFNRKLLRKASKLNYYEGLEKVNHLRIEMEEVISKYEFVLHEKKSLSKLEKKTLIDLSLISNNDLNFDDDLFFKIKGFSKLDTTLSMNSNYIFLKKELVGCINYRSKLVSKANDLLKTITYSKVAGLKPNMHNSNSDLYVETDNTVYLSKELDLVDLPSDKRYYLIDDVLRFRIPAYGWIQRMKILEEKVNDLSKFDNISPSKYPMDVYVALNKFRTGGYLCHVAQEEPQNAKIIDKSLTKLYEFATKVSV